jgi:mono/diheme cytochrome c family protein
MRSFLGGVVVTLLALFGGTYLVINRGWIAVGADNPPSAMERRIAHMATNAHVARVAPKQENPVQPTIANLIEGARNYEQRCALCHGGAIASARCGRSSARLSRRLSIAFRVTMTGASGG